jgi:5-methyltetrahydrofolate--homocysteine methyltransferase
MKKAVAQLVPYLEAEKHQGRRSRGRVVMATAKGDVHDIGKNIVGVVLQCNNFEVIDLGVMVPSEKILAAVREHQADMVGVSGLITPSLEQMVLLANELEREGQDLPLLIGGATTSRTHTALRIAPAYSGPVVWVPDASRAVTVCQNLAGESTRTGYCAEVAADYARIRGQHAGKQGPARFYTLDEARERRLNLDWSSYHPPAPQRPGRHTLRDYPLAEIARYIDWTPFFQAWDLTGRFPRILDDATVGAAARDLYRDGSVMLQRIVDERWLTANAVFGIFPAFSAGDDIHVFATEDAAEPDLVWCNLRQQTIKPQDRPNLCLADFVAPRDGPRDYLGAFALTTGIGIETHLHRFAEKHDDYSAIMLKALADRLAEAFAELLHLRVRREFWGYAHEETTSVDALVHEQYRGIRPAPGYPACPDHSAKADLFRLLEVGHETGIELTESFAMYPAAAVSGFYFSHPQSSYFAVGKIDRDQAEDYASRRAVELATALRWLAPNLA